MYEISGHKYAEFAKIRCTRNTVSIRNSAVLALKSFTKSKPSRNWSCIKIELYNCTICCLLSGPAGGCVSRGYRKSELRCFITSRMYTYTFMLYASRHRRRPVSISNITIILPSCNAIDIGRLERVPGYGVPHLTRSWFYTAGRVSFLREKST